MRAPSGLAISTLTAVLWLTCSRGRTLLVTEDLDAGKCHLAHDALSGSHFIPTCAECSTLYPLPGVSSVRGESAMLHCRECHLRMSGWPIDFFY